MWKDKDEFLDKLWEYLGLEDNDEDNDFFDHLTGFFPDSSDNTNDNKTSNNPPRRRRQSSRPRRQPRQSGYGNQAWFK